MKPNAYALRHRFASNLLAAGEHPLAVARYTGPSLAMIDRTYGQLVRVPRRSRA